MKSKILFLFVLFCGSSVLGFAQISNGKKEVSFIAPFNQKDLEITIQLITDNDSMGQHVLIWNIADEYRAEQLNNQYRGLHCYVRDSSGEIGRYVGDTWPRDRCSFSTAENQVEVFFRIRSVRAEAPIDSATTIIDDQFDGERIQSVVIPSLSEQCDLSEFYPFKLKLSSRVYRRIYLRNDDRKLAVNYRTRYEGVQDGMLTFSCDYDLVVHRKRYYIDLFSGKILRGNQWLNRRSIKKLCTSIELCLIDPQANYVDSFGKIFLGSELVKMKNVNLSSFPLHTWCKHREIPY